MTDEPQPDATDANETPETEPVAAGESAIEHAPEAAALSEAEDSALTEPESEPESEPAPRPAPKLERLQKILAQAGVASRRHAEEMITRGRVQVNGKVVTQLGSKADAAHDHIRVDGKLLHGAERLRYFMLNKPRGFVTTVKDPEGRATVMQFFEKMPERLYPVGRLDYQSEGLLVVTNDGELANQLTKAASGVEKTYLVKVSGQPTEAELDILRGGVSIAKGKDGADRVRTAPARIRQVRQGDNPWYEVVLIEGRNRELRKMFEEIGHFVEKIRRVGYGPLVLDIEPGQLRELRPDELASLRLAAEGKLRTPKAKDLRRRNAIDAQLPTVMPRPTRPPKPSHSTRPARPFEDRSARREPTEFRGKKVFGTEKPFQPKPFEPKPFRSARPEGERFRTAPGRREERPAARSAGRPAWKKDDRGPRPAGRSSYNRPAAPRRETPERGEGFAPKRPPRLRIDAVEPDRPDMRRSAPPRPSPTRPSFDRARPARPSFDRPTSDRPKFDRPRTERGGFDRPATGRSSEGAGRSNTGRPGTTRPSSARSSPDRSGTGRSGPARPFRGEGGLARPFTTSSGKPRAGGARPSSKSGKPGGRSKPGFGSRPGGGKSGYKGKPGGAKRTGPRPGGKRTGGKKHGK